MRKVRITIDLDTDLMEALDSAVQQTKQSRNKVIADALTASIMPKLCPACGTSCEAVHFCPICTTVYK